MCDVMSFWERNPPQRKNMKTLRKGQVLPSSTTSVVSPCLIPCCLQIPTEGPAEQYKFVFKKKFWFNEFNDSELAGNEVAFNLIYCQVISSSCSILEALSRFNTYHASLQLVDDFINSRLPMEEDFCLQLAAILVGARLGSSSLLNAYAPSLSSTSVR